jgi:hypothetical protein
MQAQNRAVARRQAKRWPGPWPGFLTSGRLAPSVRSQSGRSGRSRTQRFRGFMAARTMAHPGPDARALQWLVPGQQIPADVVVSADSLWLRVHRCPLRSRPDRRHDMKADRPTPSADRPTGAGRAETAQVPCRAGLTIPNRPSGVPSNERRRNPISGRSGSAPSPVTSSGRSALSATSMNALIGPVDATPRPGA